MVIFPFNLTTVKYYPGKENLADYQSKHHIGAHHTAVRPWYLHEQNSVRELPRACKPSTLKGCVGTLPDGYVHNVPLPRVPQEQRASLALTAPKDWIQLPGYSLLPAWIPTLPKLGNVLGFSQRLLWPFFPNIAIITKNNLLSYRSCLCCFREHSTPHRSEENVVSH